MIIVIRGRIKDLYYLHHQIIIVNKHYYTLEMAKSLMKIKNYASPKVIMIMMVIIPDQKTITISPLPPA